MPALRMENVSKVYGDQRVLDRVSLSVSAGERVAVIGRNGSGKTSLLRLLAGLTKPSDRDGHVVRVRGLRLGVLIDQPALFPNKTTAQHLAIASRLGGAAARCDVEEPLALEPYLRTRGKDLSVGTRKRLAIAIAILMRPDILIMDEPLSGVDKLLRSRVVACLLDRADEGTGLIYTDHELSGLVDGSDSCLLVRDGGIDRFVNDTDRIDDPETEIQFADERMAAALELALIEQGFAYHRIDDRTLRVVCPSATVNQLAVGHGLVASSLIDRSPTFSGRMLSELAGGIR